VAGSRVGIATRHGLGRDGTGRAVSLGFESHVAILAQFVLAGARGVGFLLVCI
jgi:hypothetical protein